MCHAEDRPKSFADVVAIISCFLAARERHQSPRCYAGTRRLRKTPRCLPRIPSWSGRWPLKARSVRRRPGEVHGSSQAASIRSAKLFDLGLQSSFVMKVEIEGPARWVFMRSEQCKSITGKNFRVCHTPIKSTWRLLGFEFKSIHMTDINTTTPIDLPILRPAAHCDSPDDVLNDLTLSVAEKRIILSSWASDMYHHDQGRSAPVCPGGSRLCSLGEPDGNIQSRYTVNNAAIITDPKNKPMRPKAVRPPKIPTDA